MLQLDDLAPATPRLPNRRFGALGQLAASATLHAVLVTGVLWTAMSPSNVAAPRPVGTNQQPLAVPQMVFLPPEWRQPGGGGGGGGNRQPGPIRAAQAGGSDAITVRARTHAAPTVSATPAIPPAEDTSDPPTSLLHVKPMASGLIDAIGLPTVPSSAGTSLGPGSGGGVGTGSGTGVGAGGGSGLGDGSGGGMGGGVYRPGGAVTAPRLIEDVRPHYTPEALARHVQGTVVLEAVVTASGTAAQIRVVGSLDRGLDAEAVTAVARWRFEPGRLAGQPVAVLVTIMVDFWIR